MIELLFQIFPGHKGLGNKLYGGECLKAELVRQYRICQAWVCFSICYAKERLKNPNVQLKETGWRIH